MSKYTYRNYSKTYFFNTCFDKNQLKNLVSWFIKTSGEKITVDFLETIKQIGFHQATIAGVSLGLDDLQIPSQKSLLISQAKADVSLFEQNSIAGNLTSVEKSQRMITTWNQTSEILRKTAVQQFKSTNPVNPVYMMAFSGARGNISQVRQLVAMRGLMADPQGVILEFPIQSNFREGLTITEYLISCYGARKGLVDTALRTATSGYLTRRLVDAAQHVIVSIKDCGTKEGILIKNKDLEQHLIGRVLAKDLKVDLNLTLKRNQNISPTLAKLIAKNVKEVYVRSPLTCESESSICQLCYGWNLAHGTLVSIGEAVGVIAAQSIGEPGTQLTMRTFHTGGVGVFSDQAMKYFFAPYDGVIEYTEGIPGHFVRTPHGKIVYMIKNSNGKTPPIILNLKSFQTKEIYFSLKKDDLPAGSILLVRQGEHVKTGQVLAQSSQLKTSKQKMPESTNPVFSPIDGEIYLESLTILKQKQLSPKIKKSKKSIKKETEIGPDIRTLKGLGSFWVFSSENQQEFHLGKTLLRSGDLVSEKTSLFQYDFYVSSRTILNSICNKPSLGFNALSLSIEKMYFHKRVYSILLNSSLKINKKNRKGNKELVFFTQKTLQNFLIWFPNGSSILNSGYFLNFLLYSESKKPSLSSFSKSYTLNQYAGSFFYFKETLKDYHNSHINYFKNTSIKYFLNNQYKKNKDSLTSNLLFHYPSFSKNIFQRKQYLQKDNNEKSLKFTTKFLYCKQKNYLLDSLDSPFTQNTFINKSLGKVKSSISLNSDSCSVIFQEKRGWVYIPTQLKSNFNSKNQQKVNICEQGKIFNNLLFLNSKIGIQSISTNQLAVIKTQKNKKGNINQSANWYSFKSFLQDEFLLKISIKDLVSYTRNLPRIKFQNSLKTFVYYKLDKPNQQKNITFSESFKIHKSRVSSNSDFQFTNKNKVKNFLFVQKLEEFSLPTKQNLNKQWILIKKIDKKNSRINSCLFTKQEKTLYQKNSKSTKKLQVLLSLSNGWFFSKNIFKILINYNSQTLFKKVNPSSLLGKKVRNYQIPVLGINLFFYNFISLPEKSCFYFETFENNWVVPNKRLTTGFVKIQKYGEFRRVHLTNTKTVVSILSRQNLIRLDLSKNIVNKVHGRNDLTSEIKWNTINLSQNKEIQIGNVFRSGTEIYPGISSSYGGFILKKNFNSFTIRLGIPFLASARGIIHVFQNDLIQKNDLLVTLKSRRLQTEDIVQGIPKIEQLFEARETQAGTLIRNSVHMRLKKYFISSLKSKTGSIGNIHNHLSEALTESLNKIQFFLVQSILQAYSSQGVKISQKHIEIIVRQMTTRVRILSGGDSGLLPGELIPFIRIKKLNDQLCSLGKRPAIYEPIILGITKSVLQSESFLLSASFQEVSRVLVRSALTKKKDFLRGLHENVILGQLVPTGTGLVSNSSKKIEN